VPHPILNSFNAINDNSINTSFDNAII